MDSVGLHLLMSATFPFLPAISSAVKLAFATQLIASTAVAGPHQQILITDLPDVCQTTSHQQGLNTFPSAEIIDFMLG